MKLWAGAPVAAGAVLAAVVASGCGSKEAGSGAPPVLHLDAAGAAPAAASGGLDSRSGGSTGNGYVLRATLPAGPGSAPVRRPGGVSRVELTRLAAALGVTDPVTPAKGGYRIGPRLSAGLDGQWVFGGDCAPDALSTCPIGYGVGTATVSAGSTGGGTTGSSGGANASGPVATDGSTAALPPAPASGKPTVGPSTAPERTAAPPGRSTAPAPAGPPPTYTPPTYTPPTYTPPPVASDEVARRAAAPVIAALGLPGSTTTVSYGQVSADPVVDGLRVVGATTRVSVTAAGEITYASGRILTASTGASYPLITAQQAFAQLPPRPVPAIACPVRPGTPLPCPTFPPPVVTGVELGLTLTGDETGPLLVPAWLFAIGQDPEPTAVIAVQPRFLGPPPAPSAGTNEPATAVPPAPPNGTGGSAVGSAGGSAGAPSLAP